MALLLVAALLSLVFFSVVLAIELRKGLPAHVRELFLIVGLSLAVAAFASHEVVLRHWTMIATACAGRCG